MGEHHRAWRVGAWVVLGAMVPGAIGCRLGGERSLAAENDALREERLTLRGELERLTAERNELLAKLSEEQSARARPLDEEALLALPRCVGVEIDWLSGLVPTDSSLPATGCVAYVRPVDARGRLVQVAGEMRVEAIVLGESPGDEPLARGVTTLRPLELRDAYRSGLAGSHYEVGVAFGAALERSGGDSPVLIRVELGDAVTSRVHHAERVIVRGR